MKEIIIKLHNILSLLKDFEGGYSSNCSNKMLLEYKGKKYIVKLIEMSEYDQENDIFKAITHLENYE